MSLRSYIRQVWELAVLLWDTRRKLKGLDKL